MKRADIRSIRQYNYKIDFRRNTIMRINTNTAAMNTYSNLTTANASKSGSLAKLSSGLRINKAGDDAAGLAISEKMKSQISGMTQASRNAQDGISLIQTAEGALSETHSILNRVRDLTVQASNDTNTNDDRLAIQKEITSLSDEVTRVAGQTEFNTKTLLNGAFDPKATVPGKALSFQIGANSGQSIELSIGDMSSKGLKLETAAGASNLKVSVAETLYATEQVALDNAVALNKSNPVVGTTDVDIVTKQTALDAKIGTLTAAIDFDGVIDTIDSAIKTVSTERANLGATQNRLDHTVSNLATTKENLSEANSRITDVDMAEEMMSFTKSNILAQASTSMLAQANQMPQSVLSLLQ